MPRLFLACVAMTSLALVGCGGQAQKAQEKSGPASKQAESELKALDKVDDLSTTVGFLKAADLEKVLSGPGSYTLFAPTNGAFAALPEDQRKQLETSEGRPQLIALLRQHMVPGYVTPGDFTTAITRAGSRVELASLGAGPIVVRKQGDAIVLGEGEGAAQIVGTGLSVGNSIVYKIDRILPAPAK
jgi:uncharacterized surface protein with fasciclin (FAS1) repeats